MTDNQYKPLTISHPGKTLAVKICEMDISLAEFSSLSGISETRLEQIIEGKYHINGKIALGLERVTKIPAHFWENRQRIFDQSNVRTRQRKTKWALKYQLKSKIARHMVNIKTQTRINREPFLVPSDK